MKLLEKVENCSRCGLCQQVCPIFKVEKIEYAVVRGKFLQLLGVLKGDLKFSPKIMKNLDMCLYCGKCTTHCPSGIDTVALFSQIRAEKNSTLDRALNSELVFILKMFFLKILRMFKRQRKVSLPKNSLYFKGCIKSSIKVSIRSDFKCCALPFLVKGELETYKKYAEYNMKIIEESGCDIFFDCATCFEAVSNYPFKSSETKKRLKMLGEIAENPKQKIKVTFHKPCHLKDNKLEERLSSLSNVEYIQMEASDCCGFGGDFFFRHPKVAHKLSVMRAKEVLKTGADIVFSACPTCIWSLKWGLFCLSIMKRVRREKTENVKVADITLLLS